MNSTLMTIPFVAISACMLMAATYDLQDQRVPNWLTLTVLTLGLLFVIIGLSHQAILGSIAGVAIGLAVLLPLYAKGGMGAGDVKLMAAAGAILGPLATLLAIGGSMLVGAVLSVLLAKRQKRRLLAAGAISDADQALAQQRVPFAPSIAISVIAVLAAQTFGLSSTITAGLL